MHGRAAVEAAARTEAEVRAGWMKREGGKLDGGGVDGKSHVGGSRASLRAERTVVSSGRHQSQ